MNIWENLNIYNHNNNNNTLTKIHIETEQDGLFKIINLLEIKYKLSVI